MPLAFPSFGTKGPDASLTIAAQTWCWDGIGGAVLVSSGFPLTPGQVSSVNLTQVRVFVAGVEQAVALHPLDGTFPDGSYRSLGIQFAYSLTHNVPVAAEVRINQGPRGTVDVAWVEPTYATHVRRKAVIAPTDPVHLCGTMVTLTPLTPASNDSGVAATWAAGAVARWTGTTATGGNPGGAIYDHQNGLWQMYCRTGTRSWYQWAYDWACELLGGSVLHVNAQWLQLFPYLLPTAPVLGTCQSESYWNPEALVGNNGGSCGDPNEPYSTRWIAMASAYWMTAWRQPKRALARSVNHAVRNTTVYATMRDRWIDPSYRMRWNISTVSLMSILVGYLTGCTTSFSVPGGIPGPSAFIYDTWLPWTIDALEYYTWNRGDYRDGLVGCRDDLAYSEGFGPIVFGNFQLALVAEYLMLYYDHVTPDTRIPGMLQAMASYMIGQTRAATAIDNASYAGHVWTGPYVCTREEAVVDPTFTATGSIGANTLTWESGTYTPADFFANFPIEGPGIPAGARIATTVGTTLTLLAPSVLTTAGSRTVSTPGSGWQIAMFPSLFAWVYAYTGNALYATWRDRAAHPGSMMTPMQTKNWGEWFGGTRPAYLYYAHGGTIRGTSGVHPTVITNPPLQPTLG